MTAETIHTCSYSCERPECIRAQRDELVARLEALADAQQQDGGGCSHEAWEENGGWCECVDCGHGWSARTAPPSAPVGVEGRYHPCTHILIDGLKRLEGGTAVLAEWDRARAQADAALAQQPAAVDVAAAKRAVAAVMSAPAGISVETYVRIVLEAALATKHQEPTTCKHDFRRDEDHGGACCQLCGEVRQ